MKIAIFYPFLDNIGGSEIVALVMARELRAHVYTTNIDREKIKKMGFEDLLPNIYSIGRVPINAPFRQQFVFFKFRLLNLKNKYDFYIIAGDWAMAGGVNHKPNLWYVSSPLNELFEFKDYVKNFVLPKKWMKPLFEFWVFFNRYFVKKYSQHIKNWACNSSNTKNRVKKYLNKEAVVIYPPIDTRTFYYKENGNFWLSVNRLTFAKRVDLQLKAFSNLPDENLIIVGSYEKKVRHFEVYKKYLQSIIPENVKIKHWVSKEELVELYASCKGFITTSKNEDFGMNVVEAMAAGKPVIAPNEGGYRESVINNQTGILIDEINEEKLVEAIKKLSKELKNKKNQLAYKIACQNQAKKFDKEFFVQKLKNEIKF